MKNIDSPDKNVKWEMNTNEYEAPNLRLSDGFLQKSFSTKSGVFLIHIYTSASFPTAKKCHLFLATEYTEKGVDIC